MFQDHSVSQPLIHEPKIQPLITLPRPTLVIQLICLPLLERHSLPYPLFSAVEVLEILLLENERYEGDGADGDENLIAAVVVGGIVCAIDFWVEELARGGKRGRGWCDSLDRRKKGVGNYLGVWRREWLTRGDDRANLYDYVVRCGGDGAFLDVKGVLADPG